MGIILPWELGLGWLAFNNVVILVVVYISFFFISSFIGDAIAGEHERHTLETLLASRISDRAILLGKVIVTVGYTWLLVLVSLLLGALVVNVTKGPGPWTFYAPFSLLIYTLVLSLLSSLLVASGGVLVSLHSPTVRQAQQTLAIASIVLAVLLVLGIRSLPSNLISSLDNNQIAIIILVGIAILDAILLAIALASFKRSRLILS
jgi:ABC-2 type transport system permease protein